MNKLFGIEMDEKTFNTVAHATAVVTILYFLQNFNIFNAWEKLTAMFGSKSSTTTK